VKGSKNMKANTHLKAFNVRGGTMPLTNLPITALPAQRRGGTVKSAAVLILIGDFREELNGVGKVCLVVRRARKTEYLKWVKKN
jgi:hypothetical protein